MKQPLKNRKGFVVQKKVGDGTCKFCSRFFMHLDAHIKYGACRRIYKCDTCLKKFLYKKSFDRHVLSHINMKVFQCDNCLKIFESECKLQKHKLIYLEPELFQCETCLKVLTRKKYLVSHMQRHTRKEFFECQLCSKKFKSKSGFQSHKLIHELLKDSTKQPVSIIAKPTVVYKCENFSVKFKNKDIYDKHLVLNFLEKPFKCKICSESFTLKCHAFTHSLNNIYLECELCKQSFQGKILLTRHINEKHTNNINESPQVKEDIDIVYNSLNYKTDIKSEIFE